MTTRTRLAAAAGLILSLAACAGAGSPVPDTDPGTGLGAAATAAPSGGPAAGQAGAPQDAEAPGALVVRTGTLELEVTDLSGVLPRARDLAASLGGYVAGSDESNEGDMRTASISYRIPVDRWQDALDGLRALADRVTRESTQAEEVTAQVVDLGARLTNLRASEASLRGIMDRAGTIADVLSVQEKLTGVRDQIERLTAQQNDLTGRAGLATLVVVWQTPVVALTAARSGWDIGREIDRAAAQTVGAGQAAASLGVWLIVVGIPVLGPILLIVAIGVLLYRRWAKKRPARPRQTGWGPPPGHSGPPAQPAATVHGVER